MASHIPGGQTQTFRHRITNIRLEPSTSNYDVALKILVDGQLARRLALIRRGALLSWNRALSCNADSSTRVEIRVYEKHVLTDKRVGSIEYDVSMVADQSEISLEFVPKKYTAVLSFPTLEAAKQAPATGLAEAQGKEKKRRLLDRLGSARDALKIILEFGGAVSELNPAAKAAFRVCKVAWEILEKQEQCDASVEELVVGLASMLPIAERVKTAATLPQLQNTVTRMMNLIEDASRFVVDYKTEDGPVQGLRAIVGSKAQDQVQDLLDEFQNLKEDFDRGVGVQTLEKVDALNMAVEAIYMAMGAVHESVGTVHEAVGSVHVKVAAVREAVLTSAQREFLGELKPVGAARYDSARACLLGTRGDIIKQIIDWSQQRDRPEGLLWVHGQAGLGKSSIVTSVCQELDGRKLLAAEFFCRRDSSERRDPQRVLTTIVYGLACMHSEYAKAVAEAIEGDRRLCSSPIQMQYDNLVKGPLETLSQAPLAANLVVVIDALDECGTTESRPQLLAYIHQMSQLVPWLRIVVTSRPDSDIQLFFDCGARSGVSRKNVYEYNASNDIHSFVQKRMLSSYKSTHLPPDTIQLLTERADGLFIWAKTACDLVLSSHNPKSRFDLVVGKTGLNQTSLPLDALYTTAIETSLGAGGAEDAQYVRECLGAIIVCSTRAPLSVANLSDLLGSQLERSVLKSVVDSLGSVLYTDHTQGGVVRVYHHSFADFMTSSARSGRFCVDLERQNTIFAHCCLQTIIAELKFNICGLETSHMRNSQVFDLKPRVDATISHNLRYSCLYWISHVARSNRRELEKLVTVFLLRPTVLFWVEALSLLGKLDVGMYSALELSNLFQDIEEVHQCARDIYRFILAFYDPISKSTPHLYVSALAFCPTGTTLVRHLRPMFQNIFAITGRVKEGWPSWLRCISHPAPVLAISISKDGQRIVSGTSDDMVRVWGADTGVALGDPLVGHSGSVMSVGFSPDSRRIVSGSSDKTVRVWDTYTSEALGDPLVGHSGTVRSVGFSPDGRRIVSGSDDSTVRVWNTDTGAALHDPLIGHSGWVNSVEFSPDGLHIASGSNDRTVRVWNADTGSALGKPLVGHTDTVLSVGFSPNGRRIISGSRDSTVRVWDTLTGAVLGNPLVGHSDAIMSVGFSPDGRRIISSSRDKTVQIWDADTGAALDRPLVGHSDRVNSIGFSPDGRRIISGSHDRTVRVWDAEFDAAPGNPLVGHSGTVFSVGFSPDGHRIVSGSHDRTVRVWDADTGAALGSPMLGHLADVLSVGFSPNGRRIVSGSSDKTVRMWDADSGAALGNPLIGHLDTVVSVAFSPDGRRIVSGSHDRTVQVWDADTGVALGNPLVGHSGSVMSVGFSPDGRRIVSGSADGTVRSWDADTGVALGNPLGGYVGWVLSAGFSPDGRRIVSGSQDGTVRLWDADSGEAIGRTLVGHTGTVYSVGFSPDGRHIVSGSWDRTVRVWDAQTGTALGNPLFGHAGWVLSVGFSPDGRRIVTGSADNTLRVWDMATTLSTSLSSNSLPANTPRLPHSLSADGWVCDMITKELLIWLPEEYRRSEVDDSLFVISQCPAPRPASIDFSMLAHGRHWESIYTP